MKKQHQKHKHRMNMLAACIFAVITFLGFIAAGVSPVVAVLFAEATLILPFAKMPYGILGTGTGVAGEKTAEELLKELTENFKIKNGEYETALKNLKAAGETDKATLQKAVDDLQAELKALTDQKITAEKKALEDRMTAMGEEITKLKEGGQGPAKGYKSIPEAMMAAFKEKQAEIDTIVKNGGRQTQTLEVKVAVTMGEENTIGAGATQYALTQNTGIISTIRKRELRYLANVSVGTIGTQRALWIEEKDEQGNPIFIGEGDSKTQLSVRYEEASKVVKKIAVYGKVTTEMMADLPQLISYIQNNLMRRMDIKIEDELFAGDDTGDNIAGLSEFATAFSADAELASSIPYANELDVLEAVALQVEKAFGIANAIFIHPSTMAKIKLIKDSTGRPIWKDYVTTNGMMEVSGMKLITTTAVETGTFIGGDLTVVNVLIREELGIQIGLNGNDFIENKKTMLIEKRLVQFVSANDTQVLVQGDFSTAIAALTQSVA